MSSISAPRLLYRLKLLVHQARELQVFEPNTSAFLAFLSKSLQLPQHLPEEETGAIELPFISSAPVVLS